MKFVSLDNLTRAFGKIRIDLATKAVKLSGALTDTDSFLIIDAADTETINGTASVKKIKRVTFAELKTYLSGFFSAANGMVYKGTLGTAGTVTAVPTTYAVGDTYKVITAGTWAGAVLEPGDLIIAIVARTGTGNLNGDWTFVQTNIDGAIAGPASSVDHNLVQFNGITGKSIEDSGIAAANILVKTGDGSNVVNTFSAAANHTTNLVTGETLAVSLGKILKWFTDLGAAAWLAVGTIAGTVAAGDHLHTGTYAPNTHAHGNVTSVGAIGTTIDLPIITDTAGVMIAGAWATNADIDALVI
jgi:hypothetical protein